MCIRITNPEVFREQYYMQSYFALTIPRHGASTPQLESINELFRARSGTGSILLLRNVADKQRINAGL